ncbi:MAG: lactoylglutathione lyase [Streptosporangiaceae bacterium]|nr:lactoylglutathione lyase [Streptosporangiaceae bacterium]
MDSTEEVTAATARLKDAGLAAFEENDTSCCYALQDKVWVHGPGKEPWEVYVVKADADTLGKSAGARGEADTCCD